MKKLALTAGLVAAGMFLGAPAFAKTVEMKVGQTKHITAYRGNNCNAPAPSFADVIRRIPKSKLVEYSDGGPSSRVSKDCKKRVPTRAVNGKAVKTGKETKRYQSGVVTILVK